VAETLATFAACLGSGTAVVPRAALDAAWADGLVQRSRGSLVPGTIYAVSRCSLAPMKTRTHHHCRVFDEQKGDDEPEGNVWTGEEIIEILEARANVTPDTLPALEGYFGRVSGMPCVAMPHSRTIHESTGCIARPAPRGDWRHLCGRHPGRRFGRRKRRFGLVFDGVTHRAEVRGDGHGQRADNSHAVRAVQRLSLPLRQGSIACWVCILFSHAYWLT
jgi:hypothetical protein